MYTPRSRHQICLRRSIIASCLLAGSAVMMSVSMSQAQTPEPDDQSTRLPGKAPFQAIVKADEGIDLSSLNGIESTRSLPFGYTLVNFDGREAYRDQVRSGAGVGIDAEIATRTLDGIEMLRSHGEIHSVEPNHLYRNIFDWKNMDNADGGQADSTDATSKATNGASGRAGEWFETEINLAAAHAVETGSALTRIAILDMGRSSLSNPHPDIGGSWLPDIEYDAGVEDRNSTNPYSYHHGIAVAGVASRVCPGCKLMNVKITSPSGSNYTIDDPSVVRGIKWAVDNGASILNLSFEKENEGACSSMFNDAMQYAENNDVLVVAAAGNSNGAANLAPGNCDYTLAIAATRQNGNLTYYSNRNTLREPHTYIDMAAPGGGAPHHQAGIGCNTGYSGTSGIIVPWLVSGSYCTRYMSGTSFSSPHVAGAAGLIRSRNPSLSAADVRLLLKGYTSYIGCSLQEQCGTGLLNAEAAVNAAAPLPGAGDNVPNAQAYVSCNNLTCFFNGSSSSDDQGIASYEWLMPDGSIHKGVSTNSFVPGYGFHYYQLRVTDTSGQSDIHYGYVNTGSSNVQPNAGLWTNPDRPGNRLSFFKNNNNDWVAYWSTYEEDGNSTWYLSGVQPVSYGSWSAALNRVTSTSSGIQQQQVGSISLDFSNSSTAWLSWTITESGNTYSGGARYTRSGGGGLSGIYYAPGAPVSGTGIEVHDFGYTWDTTLFAYDNQGNPTWVLEEDKYVPGSSATIHMNQYSGPGLCPGCGGTSPATPLMNSNGDHADMDITLNYSGTGNADIDFYIPLHLPYLLWSYDEPLSTLVGP